MFFTCDLYFNIYHFDLFRDKIYFYYEVSQKKLVQAAKLLTCIIKLLGSDLGRDTAFFSWSASVSPIPVGARKSYFSVVQTCNPTNPVNIIFN